MSPIPGNHAFWWLWLIVAGAEAAFDFWMFSRVDEDPNTSHKCAPPVFRPPPQRIGTADFIRREGFRHEEYQVETDDGYSATVFRIPPPRANRAAAPVVFVQHGLEMSSSCFVWNDRNNSLAFVLADAGFDVWLGNSRGNRYAQRHRRIPVEESKFWHFTFVDMARQDLQAQLGKVAEVTGKRIHFIGHAQGATLMIVRQSMEKQGRAEDPGFRRILQHIETFIALAPVTSLSHTGLMMATVSMRMNLLRHSYMSAACEFQATRQFQRRCPDQQPFYCKYSLAQLLGTETQMNLSRAHIYTEHFPDGTSWRNVYHWMQLRQSGRLRDFDSTIGGAEPDRPLREYTIAHSLLPTHIFYGSLDAIAPLVDVESKTLPEIRATGRLRSARRLDGFNNGDFLWGRKARAELYEPIVGIIREAEPKRMRK